ncbi:MAG: hypothetical protein IT518_25560 [Burkholderiales bacterium]|nr:hypothetical protein [Burkholderiales bacterium]
MQGMAPGAAARHLAARRRPQTGARGHPVDSRDDDATRRSPHVRGGAKGQWRVSPADPLLRLLARFGDEGVEYVLVGGQAVRLNGYVRATEDVDVLVRASRENGERIKRAMSFLPTAAELDPAWFEPQRGEVENIRVADELLVDLLFAANGETYETIQPHVRVLDIDGVTLRVLDIEGLLKTKTDYREKDILDKRVLERIRRGLTPD